jgi:hypothetical protein
VNARNIRLPLLVVVAGLFGFPVVVRALPIATVLESLAPAGSNGNGTEIDGIGYQINNQSDQTASPFDFTTFVVSTGTDGSNPFVSSYLSDRGWLTQPLNAISWEQPMGGDSSKATWHQYTVTLFTSTLPPTSLINPIMGYYLNYTLSVWLKSPA